MAQDLRFEMFTEAELDAACALFINAFAAEPWNEDWSRAAAHRRLGNIATSAGFVGVAAHIAEELVGFALGRLEPYRDEEHYYLQEMCVATERQRMGIGQRLLAYLQEVLLPLGCHQIYLLTARDSPPEIFYTSQGYVPARRSIVLIKRL